MTTPCDLISFFRFFPPRRGVIYPETRMDFPVYVVGRLWICLRVAILCIICFILASNVLKDRFVFCTILQHSMNEHERTINTSILFLQMVVFCCGSWLTLWDCWKCRHSVVTCTPCLRMYPLHPIVDVLEHLGDCSGYYKRRREAGS